MKILLKPWLELRRSVRSPRREIGGLPERFEPLFGALLGAAVFLGVYGIQVVYPTNFNWIMATSEVATDTQMHSLGGMFYLQDDWRWPLFLNGRVALEMQNVLSVDAIPIGAALVKLLYPWCYRGELIQYLGFWGLFCYVMQGIMGALLLREALPRGLGRYVGIVFLVLSAPLWAHYPVHTALGSHWLVLWGLWLWLRPWSRATPWQWGTLLLLSLLIHPYITAILMALYLARLLQFHRNGRSGKQLLTMAGAGMAALLLGLYLLGYFQHSIHTSSAGAGYGQLTLNLNSLINPMDQQNSQVLCPLPYWRLGQGREGYFYLGAGLLGLLIFYAPELYRKWRDRQWRDRYFWLLLCCAGLTAFALSHRITLGDGELLHFRLPQFSLHFFHTFRASGRFFWPVYYLLIVVVLQAAARDPRRLRGTLCLGAALLLQLYDVGGGLIAYRWSQFHYRHEIPFRPQLDGADWAQAAQGKERLFYTYREEHLKEVSWYALRHRLSLCDYYLTRRPETLPKLLEAEWARLERGEYQPSTLYLLAPGEYQQLRQRNPEAAARFRQLDGWFVL